MPPCHVVCEGNAAAQVIVKYAEIVLTPERPEYGGGVWHVEGMENEAICASCIAYLASDNITESRLHFRSMVTDPEYPQNGSIHQQTLQMLQKASSARVEWHPCH